MNTLSGERLLAEVRAELEKASGRADWKVRLGGEPHICIVDDVLVCGYVAGAANRTPADFARYVNRVTTNARNVLSTPPP